MPKMIDLSGRRFGRLVALSFRNGRRPSGTSYVIWSCRCDCGSTSDVAANELLTGDSKSCGCLVIEGKPRKHGHSRKNKKSPEYKVWCGMKDRCSNEANKHFNDYGGRGIVVCEKWRSDFSAFLSDMGPRPSEKHSIDRIDNNSGYEPGNCRWATASEQALNKRARLPSYRIMVDGVPLNKIAKEASEKLGIHPFTIFKRYRRGLRGEFLLAKDLRDGHQNRKRKGKPRPNAARDKRTGKFVKKPFGRPAERRT